MREQLTPFSTPNVGNLIVFEKANSILITDALLNLQRMEKLLDSIDRPVSAEELGTKFLVHIHSARRSERIGIQIESYD